MMQNSSEGRLDITYLDKMLRRLIGEHMDLVLETSPDAGSVKVDPGQMEQVLINRLSTHATPCATAAS